MLSPYPVVKLLGKKNLFFRWNILNGYQLACSTVYSTLESFNSVSFGTIGCRYCSSLCVCGIWNTASHTVYLNESQRLSSVTRSRVCVVWISATPLTSVIPNHNPLSLTIPAKLSLLVFVSLIATYCALPGSLQSQAADGHAQHCPPLRVADATALLPDGFLTHINTLTHEHDLSHQ